MSWRPMSRARWLGLSFAGRLPICLIALTAIPGLLGFWISEGVAEADRTTELVAQAKRYNQVRSHLESQFPGYWVDHPFVVQDPKTGRVISSCIWGDFVPTVMPQVDIVMIVTAKDGQKGVAGWISQKELQQLMEGELRFSPTPVPHLATPQQGSPKLREAILTGLDLPETIDQFQHEQ